MKQCRMIGSYAEELAKRNNITTAYLGEVLNCSELFIKRFFKGRTFFTFSKMTDLANILGVSVIDLLEGDEESYKASVINCNQGFDNDDSREIILDIIDDYIDLYEVVEVAKNESV